MDMDHFLAIHVTIYILLAFSPLFLSHNIQKKYGNYIFYIFYATLFTWAIAGQCPLNKVQKTTKYGSVTSFFINMGFNAKPYNNTIRFITRYVIFATTFYYSPSKNSTYATIALFILYHIVKYFSKDQTLITGAINELF